MTKPALADQRPPEGATSVQPRPSSAGSLVFHPALEGFRGVLLIAVLLFHQGYMWIEGGFLAVSSFFTLSGFLITGLIVNEFGRTGRVDLPAFWGRRVRRLMPAAHLGLIFVALYGWLAADVVQRMRLRGEGIAALFYAANWWLITTGSDYASLTGSPSPMQHFWSLAIEEQYYFVYPVLAAALLQSTPGSRRGLAIVLGALTLLSTFWMAWLSGTDVPTGRVYFATETRCAEILAGALLALAVSDRLAALSRWRSAVVWLGAVGLVATLAFWGTAAVEAPWVYTGGIALYVFSTLFVIMAAVQPVGPVRAFLSFGLFRWMGRISYGAYLYHWPVFMWLSEDLTGLDSNILFGLRVAVTLVLADVSYRWLEEPIRRGRRVLGWRRWVLPPLTAASIAALFLFITQRSPEASEFAAPIEKPALSPSREVPTIMVVGDSFSENIGKGLTRWAEMTGNAEIVNAGAAVGCGIARGGWVGRRGRRGRICDDWERRFTASLEAHRPELVVVHTYSWDTIDRQQPGWEAPLGFGDPRFDAWLASEYRDVIALFTGAGARVVWLSGVCAAPVGKDPDDPVHAPERVVAFNQSHAEPLAAMQDVEYLDIFSQLCPDGAFANQVGRIRNLRPDGNHFSAHAANFFAAWIGPQLVRIANGESDSESLRAVPFGQ